MSDPNNHLLTLFGAALECPSSTERSAYLDAACGSDAGLRARVEALLAAHDRAGGFLQPAAEAPGPTVDHRPVELTDEVLGGRYKLLERVGEGGMGEVWVADQLEPVRRRVALKVIKAGMDSKSVLARFEAERQALALMDHPNIAKVLDAGTTADGRPYFAMELVKGTPITQFCDTRQLPPRERLELFVPVCQAIQHAHTKGIIHRDVKPSNVLVALHDEKPVPKVIDFGVAKAVGQPLTERTIYTGLGALVGTPAYMAPEQATFNQLDVDTRADVYALGVLLYELLAGSPPVEPGRLKQAAFEEVLRIVREEEPPRPSQRLSTSEARASIAAVRQMEPGKLTGLLRGELDWIVMKALEKDRARRYETASAFAMDVQRYLADEPVQACPPTVGYRVHKFARRNKRAFAAGVFAVVVLSAAVTALVVGYVRVRAEERNAASALGREKDANERLTAAVDRERRVQYYLRIASAAHERGRGRLGRAEELLDQCPVELRGWEWNYLRRLPFAVPRALGLGGIVTRVAYSPDGRLLAAGNLDGAVTVWDARTGGLAFPPIAAHPYLVRGLVFSPDGSLLATGGQDHRVKVWNARSGKAVGEFRTRGGVLAALAFSPDGRLLAAAGQTGHVELWAAAGQAVEHWNVAEEAWAFQDDRPALGGLGFAPDGRTLVMVCGDGTVKFWDPTGRRLTATLNGQVSTVSVAAFSGDRGLLALGGEDGGLRVRDVESWAEVLSGQAETGLITGLSFAPGNERLASTGDGRGVKLWDVMSGQEALTLEHHARRVNALAFSPEGGYLATGGTDGLVKIADGRPVSGPTPDGPGLVLAGHTHQVVGLAYSSDGGLLASAGRDRAARVWHARTGRELGTLTGHQDALTAVAFAPADRRVASASWDGTARVWDVDTETEVRRLDARGGPVYDVAFRPYGHTVATAHHDGAVRVWDACSGRETLPGRFRHDHPVLAVAFSPNGLYLASAAGKAHRIEVWNADTGEHVRTCDGLDGIVRNLAFSPDSKYLATAVRLPEQVLVWDLSAASGEKPRAIPCAPRATRVAFSPDGRIVGVAADDRVQFLDLGTGREVATYQGHAGDIGCVAFSPEGKTVATGAGYRGWGEARIRDVPPAKKAAGWFWSMSRRPRAGGFLVEVLR